MTNAAVVATLGPASASEETWAAMLCAGATGFRLNTSHLTIAELEGWLERLLAFRAQRGDDWPIVLDLQGSKWRLGQFAGFAMQEGEAVALTHAVHASEAGTLPVAHADFFRAAVEGETIVLNDAKSLLRVEQCEPQRIQARVLRGGWIEPRKGLTLPGSSFRSEGLGAQDALVFAMARALPGVQFALSYLRDGEEMQRYRQTMGGAYLVAKLERGTALDDAARIAQFCEAVWLCRGDLGAEVGLPGMAAAAHRFGQHVRDLPVPALLAGQVLEHMTSYSTPTRAEVCGIYDARMLGYAGVVLSDETAVGQNPVLACEAAQANGVVD